MAVTIEYLWKDRKRYFGLPLSFTRYSLSEDRLFISEGFLNIKDDEILLYRVRDIDTRRSLWQRLFGVGTLTVTSSDESVAKHEAWFEKFKADYTFTAENTADILKAEIGKTFVCVLEDAGVYKCTEEGRTAFMRFVDAVNA